MQPSSVQPANTPALRSQPAAILQRMDRPSLAIAFERPYTKLLCDKLDDRWASPELPDPGDASLVRDGHVRRRARIRHRCSRPAIRRCSLRYTLGSSPGIPHAHTRRLQRCRGAIFRSRSLHPYVLSRRVYILRISIVNRSVPPDIGKCIQAAACGY